MSDFAARLLWWVVPMSLSGCCAAEVAGTPACPAPGAATEGPTAPADASAQPAPGEGAPLPAFDATQPVALLPPRLEWGEPLMTALGRRSSSRSFSPEGLDLRLLSDLLWAASGVNRPDTGGRTAPTARNRQDLDVYAATERGLYLYDSASHALVPVLPDDLRSATGMQEFAATAPLDLIYVSDLAKNAGETREDKLTYAGAHAGFAAENVYLFCASAGLATVVRAAIDRTALAAAMQLRPDQLIVLAQTVGFPGPAEPEPSH